MGGESRASISSLRSPPTLPSGGSEARRDTPLVGAGDEVDRSFRTHNDGELSFASCCVDPRGVPSKNENSCGPLFVRVAEKFGDERYLYDFEPGPRWEISKKLWPEITAAAASMIAAGQGRGSALRPPASSSSSYVEQGGEKASSSRTKGSPFEEEAGLVASCSVFSPASFSLASGSFTDEFTACSYSRNPKHIFRDYMGLSHISAAMGTSFGAVQSTELEREILDVLLAKPPTAEFRNLFARNLYIPLDELEADTTGSPGDLLEALAGAKKSLVAGGALGILQNRHFVLQENEPWLGKREEAVLRSVGRLWSGGRLSAEEQVGGKTETRDQNLPGAGSRTTTLSSNLARGEKQREIGWISAHDSMLLALVIVKYSLDGSSDGGSEDALNGGLWPKLRAAVGVRVGRDEEPIRAGANKDGAGQGKGAADDVDGAGQGKGAADDVQDNAVNKDGAGKGKDDSGLWNWLSSTISDGLDAISGKGAGNSNGSEAISGKGTAGQSLQQLSHENQRSYRPIPDPPSIPSEFSSHTAVPLVLGVCHAAKEGREVTQLRVYLYLFVLMRLLKDSLAAVDPTQIVWGDDVASDATSRSGVVGRHEDAPANAISASDESRRLGDLLLPHLDLLGTDLLPARSQHPDLLSQNMLHGLDFEAGGKFGRLLKQRYEGRTPARRWTETDDDAEDEDDPDLVDVGEPTQPTMVPPSEGRGGEPGGEPGYNTVDDSSVPKLLFIYTNALDHSRDPVHLLRSVWKRQLDPKRGLLYLHWSQEHHPVGVNDVDVFGATAGQLCNLLRMTGWVVVDIVRSPTVTVMDKSGGGEEEVDRLRDIVRQVPSRDIIVAKPVVFDF